MTEEEQRECFAIAQTMLEGLANETEVFFGFLGWDDYSDDALAFVSNYFNGLLDIVRGTS